MIPAEKPDSVPGPVTFVGPGPGPYERESPIGYLFELHATSSSVKR